MFRIDVELSAVWVVIGGYIEGSAQILTRSDQGAA